MKILLIACLTLFAACGAALTSAEKAELEAWRQWYAQQPGPPQNGARPQGAPLQEEAAAAVSSDGGRYLAGSMAVRGQKEVYLGHVNTMPRHVTNEPLLALRNIVCDQHARQYVPSKCWDEQRGRTGYNHYLAFEIEGRPVICEEMRRSPPRISRGLPPGAAPLQASPGLVHPGTGESLLGPEKTCHIGVAGLRRRVELLVKAYRNSGTASYLALPDVPDREVRIRILLSDGFTLYDLDEIRVPWQ